MDQSKPAPRPRLTRRTLLRNGAAIGALGILPMKSVFYDTHDIKVTRHNVDWENLPARLNGLKVLQMSDLHRGPLVEEEMVREAARLAMEQKPDVILLTGDFVSSNPAYIESCTRALRALKAPLGVYGVLGNHDHRHGREVSAALEGSGIRILINGNVEIAEGLWLAGVDDHMSGSPDLAATFAGIPAGVATVLMAHNPVVLDDLGPPLLVVAGHTHGGQINLGRLSGLLVPETTQRGRFISGWHTNGQTRMYINRGIGVVGIPARFRSDPEIGVFTLSPARRGSQPYIPSRGRRQAFTVAKRGGILTHPDVEAQEAAGGTSFGFDEC